MSVESIILRPSLSKASALGLGLSSPFSFVTTIRECSVADGEDDRLSDCNCECWKFLLLFRFTVSSERGVTGELNFEDELLER